MLKTPISQRGLEENGEIHERKTAQGLRQNKTQGPAEAQIITRKPIAIMTRSVGLLTELQRLQMAQLRPCLEPTFMI
jgi:hypothetical protein